MAYPDDIPLPVPEADPNFRGGAIPGDMGAAEVPGAAEIAEIPDLPRLPGEQARLQPRTRGLQEVEEEPDNLLFRFFDFSVEPGHFRLVVG